MSTQTKDGSVSELTPWPRGLSSMSEGETRKEGKTYKYEENDPCKGRQVSGKPHRPDSERLRSRNRRVPQ